jgi:hypothetical protein
VALELRPACERCGAATNPEASAYICIFECTFCLECARVLAFCCPNCGNELVRRPRRGAIA